MCGDKSALRPMRLKKSARSPPFSSEVNLLISVMNLFDYCATGENLDKKDIFGVKTKIIVITERLTSKQQKSDPFVVVSRLKEGEKYLPVFKTEVVRKTLHPKWQQFDLSLQRSLFFPFFFGTQAFCSLCRCDTKLPIKFEV